MAVCSGRLIVLSAKAVVEVAEVVPVTVRSPAQIFRGTVFPPAQLFEYHKPPAFLYTVTPTRSCTFEHPVVMLSFRSRTIVQFPSIAVNSPVSGLYFATLAFELNVAVGFIMARLAMALQVILYQFSWGAVLLPCRSYKLGT